MRKILIVLVALSVVQTAAADGVSERILRELAARIEALGEYGAEFVVRAEGNVVEGTYAVSGERYNMHTEEYDVVSDGRTRWEINHADREVLVDRVNPEDGNVLANPTRAFSFAPDVFDSRSLDAPDGTLRVELVPRESGGAPESIVLAIDGATGLPREIRYRQEGLQGEVVVEIAKIGRGVAEGVRFGFDPGRWSGYEVVDFR